MQQPDPVVITAARRTAMGGFQGALSSLPAPRLAAAAINSMLAEAAFDVKAVDEVLLGNVLPAGVGQAPARQAANAAGLPLAVPCTGISKVCGSGMKAVMLARDALLLDNGKAIVAGGMESMSNAPYLLEKARGGYRLGHGRVLDHMFVDGLEDAYESGRLMGSFAEDCAGHYDFSRVAQDNYALESLQRARRAAEDGTFEAEIAPTAVPTRGGHEQVARDEQPFRANTEKVRNLKPAFKRDGTITPANASSISDGAAAVLLLRRSEAERRDLPRRAVIRGHASHAQAPAWFTTAPVGAIKKLLERVGWRTTDVDLFEINEAFAVVAMAAMHELNLPHNRVNIHGGACALGHPIGASGARIIVTLLHAMEQYDLKRGVASLCIGGGEATAIALERG